MSTTYIQPVSALKHSARLCNIEHALVLTLAIFRRCLQLKRRTRRPLFCVAKLHQLYLNGNEAFDISIEGGTFRNNLALESGAAIAVWGAPSLVRITGGTFENNKAM